MCESDTTDGRDNPLEDRGSTEKLRKCQLCGGVTTRTAVPIRESPGDATGSGSVVQLLACETCLINLAETDFASILDA